MSKRITVLKKFKGLFKKNDVVVVANKNLAEEMDLGEDERFIWFEFPRQALSFSLGLAMANNKRIFVLCEDVDMLRCYGQFVQIGASKCKNIFLIVVGCGRYQDSGGQPSIIEKPSDFRGTFFSSGFIVYNLTPHFKFKSVKNEFVELIEKIRGPMVIFVEIEKGISKKHGVLGTDLVKFSEFVRNLELGTSLFIP